MRLRLSLKGALILAFSVLSSVLVVGYSALSARYYLSGMDIMIADNLVRAANGTVSAARDQGLPVFDNYVVTRDWHEQPVALLRLVAEPPPLDKKLYKVRRQRHETGPGRPYFYMGMSTPDGSRYVSFYISPERASRLMAIHPINSLLVLLGLALVCACAVVIVIWALLRRASKPIERLGRWAREEGGRETDEAIPDFGFSDLNDFAHLVRDGLQLTRQAMEREQAFLRQASHELRTPIAVISSNVQLLRKLGLVNLESYDQRYEDAVNRIDRAGRTMKQLTETLLWLNREDEELLSNVFLLNDLLSELIADLRYVFDERKIVLTLSVEPCELHTSEPAARIVLGNLIRNAFQHTWQGEVDIIQRGPVVRISNRLSDPQQFEQDLGFGLGLQLTERLITKLGWNYEVSIRPDGRDAQITL